MNFLTVKTWGELHLASGLLLFLFTTEAYFKIVLFSTGGTSSLLQVVKGGVLGLAGLYILKEKPKLLVPLGGLLIAFTLGQLNLIGGFSTPVGIAFIKLMYPVVLLFLFSNYKLSSEQKDRLFKAFEYVMLFNSIIILIGFFFNLKIFGTYLGSRFGFNGLFITSATSTYVYVLTLIFLLSRYKQDLFRRVPNIVVILATLLVGTKSLYVFTLFYIGVYLWQYVSFNKKVVLGLVTFVLILLVYVFFFQVGIFNKIRLEQGLLTSVMSFRDVLLFEKAIPFIKEHWGILNYLFGGVNDLSTKAQMDIFDVFYFFGIIGGGLYFHMFFKTFLVFKMDFSLRFLFGLLLIIVFLAGNFFSYPSIAIYLVIIRAYLNSNEQNQHT